MESKPFKRPWNIFLPDQILCQPSGYLTGTVYPHNNMLCVHGIMTKEIPQSMNFNIMGYWQRTDADTPRHFEDMTRLNGFRFIVNKFELHNLVFCRLEIRSNSGYMVWHPVVCIFFNSCHLGSSYILLHCTQNKRSETTSDSTNQNCKFIYRENTINILAMDVQEQQVKLKTECEVRSLYWSYSSSQWLPGLPRALLLSVPLLLIWIVCQVGLIFNLGLKYFHVCCFHLPKMVQAASIIRHLRERASCCRAVLLLDRKDRFNRFLLYNCCGQQLVDTCLGLLMILLFLYYGLANQISSYILDWADNIAKELITLVQWLMGSPAGLKLNAQLTKFLGHFFMYHIHLWTGYLILLRNVMPSVIWVCSFTGVLGVTAQMCLVADVLLMLTLHIYCFYVYAAKIFNLQVYAMGSLWRLFRGKKWNVLRSRVDSASYNIDQLFFGTLLFTILLFLIPTTALYYAVFASLRLLVLTVQGLLARIVAIVTSIPVFTIVMRLFAPKLVAGSVVFTIAHVPDDDNCLILNMKTSQIPICQLIRLTTSVLSPRTRTTHTWGQFVTYLATGKLIYPWIETVSKVKNKKE